MEHIKVVAIYIDDRMKIAPKVQEVLTKYGNNIVSRFGSRNTEFNHKGLINLNFSGNLESLDAMKNELNSLEGVNAQSICIE